MQPVGLSVWAQSTGRHHFFPKLWFIVVCSGCRNTRPKTRWPKQRKLIFSQFWRLEVQDQGAHRFGFWWDLSSWLVCGHLLAGSRQGFSFVCVQSWCLFLFLYGHQSYGIRALHLWSHLTKLLPESSCLQILWHWELGLQPVNLGRDTIQVVNNRFDRVTLTKVCWKVEYLWKAGKARTQQ